MQFLKQSLNWNFSLLSLLLLGMRRLNKFVLLSKFCKSWSWRLKCVGVRDATLTGKCCIAIHTYETDESRKYKSEPRSSKCSLPTYLGQRRNKLTCVLTYLHNPNAVDPRWWRWSKTVMYFQNHSHINKKINQRARSATASKYNDTGTQLTPVGDSGEVGNRQSEVM